ncbi:hypothetical protein AaE_010778 [Aphanomyces astaci]|uniref:Dynein heavy chain C-terminal domain-containing protein n=1 Tax=Aphanomyces astaci TaxID=112090 RepID=A0A6A4ZY54_APHAT|nr:hypothetical protein AaE_010778 [Aphanomyces astaci]
MAADILGRLPDNYDMELAAIRYPVKWNESMNTVLCQELVRFNNLLAVVRLSLKNVRKAIQDQIAFDHEAMPRSEYAAGPKWDNVYF